MILLSYIHIVPTIQALHFEKDLLHAGPHCTQGILLDERSMII